jgi:hypothetical protein
MQRVRLNSLYREFKMAIQFSPACPSGLSLRLSLRLSVVSRAIRGLTLDNPSVVGIGWG